MRRHRLGPAELKEFCVLDESSREFPKTALADLDGEENIGEAAIAGAVQFRSRDRQIRG